MNLPNALYIGMPFGVNIHMLNRMRIMSLPFQKCVMLHPGSVSSPLNLIRVKFLHMKIGLWEMLIRSLGQKLVA